MARMSISIPDQLKARMDEVGQNKNWSNIAQRAFELELDATETKGNDMDAVIERLRASKMKIEEPTRVEWTEYGRSWAKTTAQYDELEQIGELDLDDIQDKAFRPGMTYLLHLGRILYNDEGPRGIDQFHENFGGEAGKVSGRQARWFLDGAQAVWNEVQDHV